MPTIDVQAAPDLLPSVASRSFGLDCPPGLLEHAPQLPPATGARSAASSEPIRIIGPSTFATLHSDHLLSHAPDHVLFPFFHGIEGDNFAQNTFFHNSAAQKNIPGARTSSLAPKIPKYRGLVWILCDDDLLDAPRHHRDEVSTLLSRNMSLSSLQDHSEDDMSCSDDDFDEGDTDEEDEMPPSAISDTASMNLDVDVRGSSTRDALDGANINDSIADFEQSENPNNALHMHPVKHRELPSTDRNLPLRPHETSPESSMGSVSSSEIDPFFSGDRSQDSASFQTSVDSDPSALAEIAMNPGSHEKRRTPYKSPPAILTGTLRPSDVLQRTGPIANGQGTSGGSSEDDEWEFVPLKVPGGISLRNFGIQVPIYVTLSDIVVYSPKGNTANVQRLARRLQAAQRKKRAERAAALGIDLRHSSSVSDKSQCDEGVVGDMEIDEERPGPGPQSNADDLLQYRTFILDGTSDDLRRQIPNLVIRMRSGGGVGASASASAAGSGQDVLETARREAADHGNTVDFALREREEMRDLTEASEILSLVPVPFEDAPNSLSSSEESRHSALPSMSRTMEFAITNTNSAPATPSYFASGHFSATTTATHWDPAVGQVFLGNTSDVPVPMTFDHTTGSSPPPYSIPFEDIEPLPPSSLFNPNTDNHPGKGFGYDVCIECHDVATMPLQQHLLTAEEHLKRFEAEWVDRCVAAHEKYLASLPAEEQSQRRQQPFVVPPRPPPNADNIIHIPLPSSPQNTVSTCNQLINVLRFIERWVRPGHPIILPPNHADGSDTSPHSSPGHARRWSAVSSVLPTFISSSAPTSRSRSFTSPQLPPNSSNGSGSLSGRLPVPSRPLKVLLYSSDGYTESSVPALCLLMAIRHLTLPEAYLALQVEKHRSFFVYNTDLPFLKRVDAMLSEERRILGGGIPQPPLKSGPPATRLPQMQSSLPQASPPTPAQAPSRPAAKSVSFAQSPVIPARQNTSPEPHAPLSGPGPSNDSRSTPFRRPRAITSPPSMFGVNHQAWFNDSRFDGSFPSRILPFMYLGNLNHASNVYMLHALGITHVVSVGECALIPPPSSHVSSYHPSLSSSVPSTGFHCPAPNGYERHGAGSLWVEEKEGRIKVLDIKGVCDDGIDTLEPQLEPICNWIDEARKSGGQILVHCRVGVSRSATVTIAYVMKHLNIPLVDAYLVVRSRRLSVLIQPNMRLLYNLCGWEIRLAKERANGDGKVLRDQLSRALPWPYLAKEVHALNEKYLR